MEAAMLWSKDLKVEKFEPKEEEVEAV